MLTVLGILFGALVAVASADFSSLQGIARGGAFGIAAFAGFVLIVRVVPRMFP